MPVREKQRIRFGPFEFDPESGELFKNCHKVKLEGQPAKVLSILLERPGALVSREELSRRLWSADTFVDSERILNADIWKLRQALGDNADRPRYIETLPRKGYRFIGELEQQQVGPPAPELTSFPTTKTKSVSSRMIVTALAIVFVFVMALIGLNISGVSTDRVRSIQSLAVLPFKNLSENREHEYLADAVTDALIANLGKAKTLRVPSLTSSMAFKNSSKPLKEIAKELHVDAAIEGSVVRSGDRIRVTVQLVQASDDSHLWAETYDGKFSDVLLLQSEIAQSVCSEIKLKLAPAEKIEIATARTVDPEAYDLYLKGRYQDSAWREVDKAIDSFQRSIAKDPSFAPAYAELSMAYSTMGFFAPPNEIFPKARAAADKARELDPTLAEAYAASALIKTRYEWDWIGAEADFKHALELKPNDSQIHSNYAIYLAVVARPQEAIQEARKGVGLDPASLEANLWLAGVYMKTHHFDESIAQFRHVLSVDSSNGIANYQLPWVLAFQGRCGEAIRDYERMAIKTDPFLAYFYTQCGRKAEALRILWELERSGFQDPLYLAIASVGLEDNDRVVALLKIAYYERDAEMMLLKVDPWWDNLRSDPGFQELLARMNFPS